MKIERSKKPKFPGMITWINSKVAILLGNIEDESLKKMDSYNEEKISYDEQVMQSRFEDELEEDRVNTRAKQDEWDVTYYEVQRDMEELDNAEESSKYESKIRRRIVKLKKSMQESGYIDVQEKISDLQTRFLEHVGRK
ncbi:MAG: hypothetical protein E7301_11510 [Butyrivibrio sp.]|nr:hypothetical protein [Butyrivibrio sp.]